MNEIKTLYISDVDGTLYRGGEASLREETVQLFRQVLQTGAAVTIASGRNLYGIYDLADESGITLPVIAYNGAAIYDYHTGREICIFPLEKQYTGELCDIFEQLQLRYKACVFFKDQHRGVTFNQNGYRSQLWTDKARQPENGLLYDEPIIDGTREQILSGECLYIGSSGSYEQINQAYQAAKEMPGVQVVMHRSPYDENKWFIDIGSDKAGKGAAAMALKELLGAQELVTFGDNRNDLPMLCASDRCYVVPEAPDEVKAVATDVLDDDPDCVLHFLLKENSRQEEK